ncbi:hypothetical protein [Micromonospora sonneratiae]
MKLLRGTDATAVQSGDDQPDQSTSDIIISSEEQVSDMSLSQIVINAVKSFRSSVPDCVAAGVVDMSTGMLLSVETTDSHPQEVLDLLAAATFDLFQGRNVTMIEDMFKARRGVSGGGHYFQEILVNSQNLTHLFLRSTVSPNIVAAIVCRRSVNIGMMFAQARLVMRQMEAEGV